jgi:hypothetical protein
VSDEAAGLHAAIHSLFQLTAHVTRHHPTLICVDDARWADLTSLHFLHYLARRLGDSPIARPVVRGSERRSCRSLLGGGATVALRVNPDDHSQIALDLASEPPVITVSAGDGDAKTGSAAEILDLGVPCRAVIVESSPLGRRNPAGVDLYAFALTILADGRPPYQTKLGRPVPPEAVLLLYPGNNVPAKRLPDREDHFVMIDWPEARRQVEQPATTR